MHPASIAILPQLSALRAVWLGRQNMNRKCHSRNPSYTITQPKESISLPYLYGSLRTGLRLRPGTSSLDRSSGHFCVGWSKWVLHLKPMFGVCFLLINLAGSRQAWAAPQSACLCAWCGDMVRRGATLRPASSSRAWQPSAVWLACHPSNCTRMRAM